MYNNQKSRKGMVEGGRGGEGGHEGGNDALVRAPDTISRVCQFVYVCTRSALNVFSSNEKLTDFYLFGQSCCGKLFLILVFAISSQHCNY